MALSMTAIFLASPSSESPAPLPVISSAGRPSRAAATALVVVVLPMPISPAARRSRFSAKSPASSMPASSTVRHSSRVMAGSRARFFVPRETLMDRIPGTSVSMPASTGITSAPATAPIQHTLAAPVSMFPATTAVTPLSVWVTPSATTPLSAQKAATHLRRSRRRGATPASRDTTFSSCPRPWRGLATASQWRRAASTRSLSAGLTAPSASRSLISRSSICTASSSFVEGFPQTL